MQNDSTALIAAFEQHYDTSWNHAQLRNERIAWRAAWAAALAAPAAVAGPAWDKTRDSLSMLMMGFASNPSRSIQAACAVLDSATEPGMPLAYLRGTAAAPQAPAAPTLGDAERLAAARQDQSLADYWRNRVAGLAEEFTTTEVARYLADQIVANLYDLPASGVARPAAPAAPAVDAPKELDPGLSREVYRACEDLPEGWAIRIDLENGYGSVKLIDPDGEENELPVDGWLSDAMRASIAAAQAAAKGE